MEQKSVKTQPVGHLRIETEVSNFFNGGQIQITGSDLLWGKLEGKIAIFDSQQKRVLGQIEHKEEDIYNFAVHQGKDNTIVYSFTDWGALRQIQCQIDLEKSSFSFNVENILQKNDYLPVYMKIDQHNHYLFACDSNGVILVFDVRRMQVIKELWLGFGFMKLQIYGNTIIFLSKERKIFLYDLSKDKKTKVIQSENKIQFSSFTTIDQKGDSFLLAGFDGHLYESKQRQLKIIENLGNFGFVSSMETLFIKDKIIVLIGNEKGQVFLIQVNEQNEYQQEELFALNNTHEIGKILIDGINQKVYIISNESELFVLKLISNQNKGKVFSLELIEQLSSYHDQILDIKKTEQNNILVCTNSDYIKYYDLETKKLSLLTGHKDIVTCCDYFSGNLVTGSKDGKIFVWQYDSNGNSFRIIKKYKAHQEAVAGISLGKKTGRVFVSADLTGEIKVWNLDQGKFKSVKVASEDLNFVRCSPNERIIITGSKQKQLFIIDAVQGVLLSSQIAHKKGIWDAEFNFNSTQIASVSSDCTIKIWTIKNRELENTQTLETSSPALKVKWISQDLQLVTSHSEGQICIWNLVKGCLVYSMVLRDSRIWALETMIINNKLQIITGDNESNLIVLQDDTQDYKLENIKLENESKVAKEKLQIYLDKHEYQKALQHCIEFGMHSSFFRVVEQWIGSYQWSQNTLVYSQDFMDIEDKQEPNYQEIEDTIVDIFENKTEQLLLLLKNFMSWSKHPFASQFVLQLILRNMDYINIQDQALKIKQKIHKHSLQQDLWMFSIFTQRNEQRLNTMLKRQHYLKYILGEPMDLNSNKL